MYRQNRVQIAAKPIGSNIINTIMRRPYVIVLAGAVYSTIVGLSGVRKPNIHLRNSGIKITKTAPKTGPRVRAEPPTTSLANWPLNHKAIEEDKNF